MIVNRETLMASLEESGRIIKSGKPLGRLEPEVLSGLTYFSVQVVHGDPGPDRRVRRTGEAESIEEWISIAKDYVEGDTDDAYFSGLNGLPLQVRSLSDFLATGSFDDNSLFDNPLTIDERMEALTW